MNVDETIYSKTNYYKDKNNVYYYTLKKVNGVDPNTVKVVNTLKYEQLSNTIKDKNNWYQDGIVKKESDLITFWAGEWWIYTWKNRAPYSKIYIQINKTFGNSSF